MFMSGHLLRQGEDAGVERVDQLLVVPAIARPSS
jgi:hypothetical protein